MATLKVNFISPSPAPNSTVGEKISVWGNVALTGGKFLKLASVTVQFGTGGQSVKASINGVSWSCTGNAKAVSGPIQISATATVSYIPTGFPTTEPDAITGIGTLPVIVATQPIATVLNLNGKWAYGGIPGPAISVNGNSIVVDMSAYNRPTAHGSITDSSDIMVTFPDDKGYTGRLQPPSEILWSNNSAWTKVNTLFSSSFDFTANGATPSPVQAVGTASVAGPANSVIVVQPPFASTLKWVEINGGQLPTNGASFVGNLTAVNGPGVYTFSASLFVPTGSSVCSISFQSAQGDEAMHIDFTADNKVRVDDVTEFGSFVRDKVFLVQTTLNITTTQSTAVIAVSGGGAAGSLNYTLTPPGQRNSLLFGAIRVWKGFGDPGLFYATSIVVTH